MVLCFSDNIPKKVLLWILKESFVKRFLKFQELYLSQYGTVFRQPAFSKSWIQIWNFFFNPLLKRGKKSLNESNNAAYTQWALNSSYPNWEITMLYKACHISDDKPYIFPKIGVYLSFSEGIIYFYEIFFKVISSLTLLNCTETRWFKDNFEQPGLFTRPLTWYQHIASSTLCSREHFLTPTPHIHLLKIFSIHKDLALLQSDMTSQVLFLLLIAFDKCFL